EIYECDGACSCHRAPPKQAEAACEADQTAHVCNRHTSGHPARNGLPDEREVAIDEPQGAEADQGCSKNRDSDSRELHDTKLLIRNMIRRRGPEYSSFPARVPR